MQDARGFFFMLIVFVLGSVLVSSVFLSWLWFFLLFCCCLFSCFFLYGLSSIFFRFGFFFLEFFLLCVRFPLSLFSYEKCFCAHVQTWPRRYRDHADHEPDDPGPGVGSPERGFDIGSALSSRSLDHTGQDAPAQFWPIGLARA